MRISRDEWGLRLAEMTALRGTCLRRQVGCVLVDYAGNVLATGYNGVTRGKKHCNEEVEIGWSSEKGRPILGTPFECHSARAQSGSGLDFCEAVHAEQNACLQCHEPDAIYTCYVTVSPCVSCLKLLLNTECGRIVFRETYAQDASHLWEFREWLCIPRSE